MSRKYKFHNPKGIYFVTFTINKWIDVFTRQRYCHIFIDCIKYYQVHQGLEVFSYCIMHSHVHMLMRTVGDKAVNDVIRDLKKISSKKILQAIRSHPKESRREWLLKQIGILKKGITHSGEQSRIPLNVGV